MFVPLHARSACSLGFGVIRPAELAGRTAEGAMPAVALTDVENLYGQLEFHRAARAFGIRPITGLQIESPARPGDLFAPVPQRLVLLARNEQGFAQLCRIVSRRRTDPHRIEGESVAAAAAAFADGLFLLSDRSDVLAELLRLDVPGNVLRGMLVRPAPPRAEDEASLRAFCGTHEIPLVADPDVVLLDADDYALHALRLAIARGTTVAAVTESADPPDRHRLFRTVDEAANLFADVPDALAESGRVAEACNIDLLSAAVRVPPDPASARPAVNELADRCRAMLGERSPGGTAAARTYEARLASELEIIADRELAGYFLMVDAIAREARRRGIGVAARGSAVSSLVAYLLRISAVDPVAENLVFERFLNPLRRDFPDVDLDVASDRREELIEWTYEHFGRDRTATVGALHRTRARTAYREGLTALGMQAADVTDFVRRIRERAGEDEDADVPTSSLPESFRNQVPVINRLIGLPHHFSAHPGGIVIAHAPLEGLVPLERAEKGVIATQFDMRAVKQRGLVKIDLLGNHALSELGTVQRLVRISGETDFRWDAIPRDDEETLRLLDAAETIGCFQVESPALRSVLRRMPISALNDVTVALALVRPGAAAGHAKANFLRRAAGLDTPDGLHPLVANVLRPTHGILLFEEDLIRLISAATGRPAAWADRIRAAIVRGHATERTRRRFLREARSRLEPAAARSIWRDLAKHAAYSFSRAHAVSYAVLACYAAYAKVHHPVPFTCALIDHHGGLYPLRSVVAEMARRGVVLRGPSVALSAVESIPEDGAVRIGLARVKHLSQATLRRLLAERETRPFGSLSEFEARVRPSRRERESLVLSGACDGLAPLDAEGYPFIHDAILANTEPPAETPPNTADVRRLRALVRVRNELRFLGLHVHAHPMAVLRPDADALGVLTTGAAVRATGESIQVAGVVAASRIIKSGAGTMQFFTLEDETGTLECALAPAEFRRIGNRITTPGPFVATGVVRADLDDVHLDVTELTPFHQRARRVSPAS